MSESELSKYAQEFRNKNGNPNVIKLPDYLNVRNMQKSSSHEAWGEVSWIDYWRALTGNYENQQKCACCGKIIFADVDTKECQELVKIHRLSGRSEITADVFQAEGAHIVYAQDKSGGRYNGTYIVPLCKKCNSSANDECFEIKAGSILCEEIDYSIKNSNHFAGE